MGGFEMAAGDINLWIPEPDPIKRAMLGKMGEEAGELSTRLHRALIQGLDAVDPDTGRTNREEIEREISDVEACIAVLQERFNIKPNSQRMREKANGYRKWLGMLDNMVEAVKKVRPYSPYQDGKFVP